MPKFNESDMDIEVNFRLTPRNFIAACKRNELDELIRNLVEDGEIRKFQASNLDKERMGPAEFLYESHLSTLHGKWNLLTSEEESMIIQLAKRFNCF